jgi:hypothetical protein
MLNRCGKYPKRANPAGLGAALGGPGYAIRGLRVYIQAHPTWVKVSIDGLATKCRHRRWAVFRSVSRGGDFRETALSEKVVATHSPVRRGRWRAGIAPTTIVGRVGKLCRAAEGVGADPAPGSCVGPNDRALSGFKIGFGARPQ